MKKPKTGYYTTRLTSKPSSLKKSQDMSLIINDSPLRERKVKCDPYFKHESF